MKPVYKSYYSVKSKQYEAYILTRIITREEFAMDLPNILLYNALGSLFFCL